jgi:hypothetical protein
VCGTRRNNINGLRLLVRSSFQQKFGRTDMRTAEQYGLDDNAVQAMGRAFDIACARLSRTGIMLPNNLDRMQKIAAQQLVMYARNGERNEWRLARRAIFAVCAAVAGEKLGAGMAACKPGLVVEQN